MKEITSKPRLFARALAALLWVAGSSYLIRNEWSMPNPDWVVIVALPLIWAAVIALPILAHFSAHQRQWLAAGLLTVAAILGACFTLSGTISRQSEARDGKVAAAQAANFKRSELMAELELARSRYDEANRNADLERGTRCGPRCKDWERRAEAVREIIGSLTNAIAVLGADRPVASGEKRLAAAISALPFVTASKETVEANVALFHPCLFGVFLEFAALALAFFGWHPTGATSLPKPANSNEIKAGSDVVAMAGVSQPSALTEPEWQELPSRDMFSGDLPEPPKPRRKRSTRDKRRDTIIKKIRAQTLAGKRPSLKVVQNRYNLPRTTAWRRLKEAAMMA